jgi:hypothetical protein
MAVVEIKEIREPRRKVINFWSVQKHFRMRFSVDLRS